MGICSFVDRYWTGSRCVRYCNRLSARFGGETPVCLTTTRAKT